MTLPVPPNIAQGSPEWVKFRKSHIGGSDIAIILGISPWKTPYQLWCEKTGRTEPEKPNAAMERGKMLEKEAEISYMDKTGNIVVPKVVVFDEWPIAMASLDGITEDGNLITEYKAPNKDVMKQAQKGIVPEYYLAQCQWNLMCSGAKSCDYFVYHPDGTNFLVNIQSSFIYQEKLLIAAKKFWIYIENDEPPPNSEEDITLIEDDNFGLLAKDYISLDRQIKDLTAKKNEKRDALLKAAKGQNVKGFGLSIKKQAGVSRINYEKIFEDFVITDEELKSYTVQGDPVWRISLITDKKE